MSIPTYATTAVKSPGVISPRIPIHTASATSPTLISERMHCIHKFRRENMRTPFTLVSYSVPLFRANSFLRSSSRAKDATVRTPYTLSCTVVDNTAESCQTSSKCLVTLLR